MLIDHSLLQAALEGLELKRSRIDKQIAQVKQALSGKESGRKSANAMIAEASEDASPARKVSKKRVVSPEARERMEAARNAR